MLSAMKMFLAQFKRDTRGSVAIIAAILAPALFAIGGAAYDFGNVKMAWENSQHSGDIAATSAAGARRFEPWGKIHTGGDGEAQRIMQEARVNALYTVNTRGFNFNPDWRPNIRVTQEGTAETPYMTTRVAGSSSMGTGFVKMIGIDSLPYTVDTIVRHRLPGPKVTFDVTMFLDYTTSMRDNALAGGGSKISMLKQTAESLVDWVMCGNEQGVDCDPENTNRLSFIPYTTTSIGLDICDLAPGETTSDGETRPIECDCRAPRGFPGGQEAWEAEENRCSTTGGMGWPNCRPEECRAACDRRDSSGLTAADPGSAYFNCACYAEAGRQPPIVRSGNAFAPVDPDTGVQGQCSGLSLVGYPEEVSRCVGFCMDGACCPPSCASRGADGRLSGGKFCEDYEDGTADCAGCIRRNWPTKCGCDRLLRVDCTPPTAETRGSCSPVTQQVPQTYQCHHQSCNCSCSSSGGPQPGCVARPDEPDFCLPPNEPPSIPPGNPGLGFFEDFMSQVELASANGEEGKMIEAVYRPGEDEFGSDAKLFMTQGDPGCTGAPVNITDMAISLEDCQDYGTGIGSGSCGEHIKNAMASDCYLENFGTTSSAAFIDFGKYMSFRDWMRPSTNPQANQPGLPDRMQNVVIWISDGENTRFSINNSSGAAINMPRPGKKRNSSGQLVWQDIGTATNHGPDWDAFINNCYYENGTEFAQNNAVVSACPSGTCGADPQCPNQHTKTGRQWADHKTIEKCDELRIRKSPADNVERMTIYSIFIAGENTTQQESDRVTNLMLRCSWGEGAPTLNGQGEMPRVFYVDDYDSLRGAFQQITSTLDSIRIIR